MGRGDKKTRRGKISRGTFGKRRPRLRNKKSAAKPGAKPAAKAGAKPVAKEASTRGGS